jgi:DNA mismatch repair protein MutS2
MINKTEGLHKFLDENQRKQIGFDYVMEKLQVITPYGQKEKRNARPFKRHERKLLLQELENIKAVVESYEKNIERYNELQRIMCRIKDIANSIKSCEIFKTLDDVELFEIKNFSILISEIIQIYGNLILNFENVRFRSLENIVSLLDPENKRLATFHIYDNYSSRLKDIRNRKRETEERIFRCGDGNMLSALKEQRLELVVQEEQEELEIRKQLSEKLRFEAGNIKEDMLSLGKLDYIIAKARLALSYDAVMPSINENMTIYLSDAVTPEVSDILKAKDKAFTPVSVILDKGTTVITGANMGGKSVTLKTVILNLLLANMGFFVFARKADVPMVDFIHYISDDMQSVSQGLSSFGAEIIRLKKTISDTKSSSGFIALDEFARGTNPQEGFFIVKAVAKYLNSKESISLICTHYDRVPEEDMVHYQVIGLKNTNLQELKNKIVLNSGGSVDLIQSHMDYRLERLSSYSSVPRDALNISILLGLQEELVEIISQYYVKDTETMEGYDGK